ncbi:MAG: hypothetical protein IPM21_04190 [Acidobacteria bacterium]|nr:hypothetical protein [Acidobacteriota bacterium]
MATAHTFLATDEDLPLVLNWLRDAGAVPVADGLEVTEFGATGHEIAFYFPAIGKIEYYPSKIDISQYPENSATWLQAFLCRLRQENDQDRKIVDSNKTPSAGLKLPDLREDRFWVTGEVWFPTVNLRKTFPELAKICGRFERWIRKFPCVFDNRTSDRKNLYPNQLAQADIVKCINALPHAHSLLENGHHVFDHMVSQGSTEHWKKKWGL